MYLILEAINYYYYYRIPNWQGGQILYKTVTFAAGYQMFCSKNQCCSLVDNDNGRLK